MTQEHFFGKAKWVGAADRLTTTFSILRGYFNVCNASSVTLNVLGLGFFKCYINGKCINPDTFLPLSSDYENSRDPRDEIISGHRIYVPEFDITPFVKQGKNVIDVHFGGGWYTFGGRPFGLPKAIYQISVFEDGVVTYFCSDESCMISESYVSDYNFINHETHNYAGESESNVWTGATAVESLSTEYCRTDCPHDALIRTITPTRLGEGESGIVYDCGENTTGYPVLDIPKGATGEICVLFSEDILPDGKLDMSHHHKQKFTVLNDGSARTVQPEFTWFAFRYFEVIGNADISKVKVVHANVDVSSSFESDSETLNWIYKTFIHTMLCNMHTGHPSDCPHLERRGYTGDGQLTCHAVLSVFDARAFYEKWLQDIADCQDILSGHIQYTAPYVHSGGGPGGWGSAIVEVPYQLYRHYGDKQILSKYYQNMRRYIDYLEAHSEFSLVTSDKEGDWCLGDWCGPNILYPDKDITFSTQQVIIPAPMVNTYFMVRSLDKLAEIARIIGKDEDIAEYEQKSALRRRAIQAAYFNTFDGNFVMNIQGANAFAVDLGLGNSKTYPKMKDYYTKLGHYDTGIFGTDILTRVLFERGDSDLAVDLLLNNGDQGFEHWRQNGATTFHEYWDSNRCRSHNHPMFGAPVAYFFEYLLGIRQSKDSAAYTSLVIEPMSVSKFNYMRGSMATPNGTVAVSYEKSADGVDFTITIPENTKAVFKYDGTEYALSSGINKLRV